ncbi:MAG: YlmC/YmxH family sporulation protein [Firmicutes bacterium]|nr:YlmC/YmxH family sporulation protein [Bacillota bacterium]
MISTQDLRNKEVINIHNGKSLGFVEDIAVDLERGIVEGIVIPQQSSGLFSFFGKGGEIIIPWNAVRRVGEEVLLVELGGENELAFERKDG